MPIASSSHSGMVSAIDSSTRIQVECPYCGHRNYSTIEFCEKCRASI
jgi:hypothetical protein